VTRTRILLALLSLGLAQTALAQLGPIGPRIVEVAVPIAPPDPDRPATSISAQLELDVGVDGRVASYRVTRSSGERKFDVVLIKFYRKWRLIPAVDAQGKPTTGVLRINYEQPKKGPPRSRIESPTDVNAEKDRVNRMTCRDFLWEYQFMRQIAGKFPVENEPPLRAAFALYLVKHPTKNRDELSRLSWAHRPAIDDSAAECTARPALKFWSEVYEPKLARHFAKGSKPAREWPPKKKPKTSG